MGIFNRISDIVAANLNDLIEGYEDPEKMLRQAVREMEEAIRMAKPDVVRAMANEKTIAKEFTLNERKANEWAERAATAAQCGDEALARKALIRKREYEKVAAALGDQVEVSRESSQILRRQFEAMQAKLKDAERRLGTLVARQRAANIRAKMAQSHASTVPEMNRDAFDKFNRLTRRVEMAEAEADAMTDLAQNEKSLESTYETMAALDEDAEIEAELAKLKENSKAKVTAS